MASRPAAADDDGVVIRPSHVPGVRCARETLGERHPLVRALADLDAAARQLAAVAAALGAGVVGTAAGASWGRALTVAAALVAVVMACRVLLARDAARRRACDVLIEGAAGVAVPVVNEQRRRLLDPGYRERLASSYEDLALLLGRSRGRLTLVVSAATPELPETIATQLQAVADALRDDRVGPGGVALAERLLTDGTSPLYGPDRQRLRAELVRTTWHLEARD
jgi:hypothetical protein